MLLGGEIRTPPKIPGIFGSNSTEDFGIVCTALFVGALKNISSGGYDISFPINTSFSVVFSIFCLPYSCRNVFLLITDFSVVNNPSKNSIVFKVALSGKSFSFNSLLYCLDMTSALGSSKLTENGVTPKTVNASTYRSTMLFIFPCIRRARAIKSSVNLSSAVI